jgi:hypothetical protein
MLFFKQIETSYRQLNIKNKKAIIMANEFDIFNLGVSDIDTYQAKEGGSDLYKPTADQGKDGVYRALVRFIPNPKNPQKSIIRKYVYWLEDGEGNGSYYDSPSTIGEKCPVQDLFFKLRNSESAVDKKMSEKLKRREIFYSLVQIIKDPHNSDMNGQIKIFKYGYKIKQKIDEELNPQFDEPCQVFDLFEGKNFELVITKQGGYNNYDSSKFQGKRSSVEIGGELMKNDQGSRQTILDYLKDSPSLDSFDFKAWDDSTRSRVESILNTYRSPGSAISSISSRSVEESFSFDDAPAPKKEKAAESKKQEAPAASASSEESDDLNDFLNGLDI